MILARDVAADLILSGHDEHLLTYYDGRVAMTESDSQGDFVVVTEITIDKTEEDGEVEVSWRPTFRVIDTATVEPDPEIAAAVQTYVDKLDAELKVEIGTTETPLDSRRATVRGQEAAIGNLIADATREAVDADIGITNGGGIRADKEYPAGTVLTRGDILAELPFGNVTVKLELTGEQILAGARERLQPGRRGGRALPARFRHDRRGRSVEAAGRARPVGDGRRRAARSGKDLYRRDQRLHGRRRRRLLSLRRREEPDRHGRRGADGDAGDRLHHAHGHDRPGGRGPHQDACRARVT